MIKNLLEKAIEQKNSFMTMEMIALQIEFFFTAGRITDMERQELLDKLYPPIPPEEDPIES